MPRESPALANPRKYSPFFISCQLLVVNGYWLFVTCYLLLVICYLRCHERSRRVTCYLLVCQ
ncbi:MAG: hypothetical protein EAZ90_26105 [Oscillatoriales cyanobacterium]|nr:MAG: hypothetical protein EAZ94_14425 [Oscillatoriales cyanobacterium]TAE20981.1 MAG: hypothetical protein EAZ93_21870 [Oscillatoriales cyanobacterium]TAE37717.1 MAG: hypothetical protein EAZ90_26105 [Oscillatoriales cyanobacterium]TAE51404.1 MAG: hypothetical protein EAZ88_18265 [Oscillatoriales cyanobacterium]TAE66752.1 MAG: hypothetical protein EAZ86_19130 [Oscillatoriales cyanobacterium]